MTTQPEIKRWVRPFVESRDDVVRLARSVLVRPVHHIARGIYFASTGDRTRPDVAWFMQVLFAAPGSWNAFFEFRFGVGQSTDADFPLKLSQAMRESFEQRLLPIRAVADFYDFATGKERRFTFLNLDDYGLEHGTVLAALGRVDEAEAVLERTIADDEARAAAEQQAEDEYRNARPRPRGVVILDVWRQKLAIVEHAKELLARVRQRDRSGIAALLREWEQRRVSGMEIAPFWEPTPFPIETDQ